MSIAMAFTHIFCLFVVLISSSIAFHDPNPYFSLSTSYDRHRVDTRSARRYCGSEITRTLTFLCESYNKRSSYPERNPDQDNENIEGEEGVERPKYRIALVKLLRNVNDLGYYRRQIRGVVDDCCKRSCTTHQLAQYCDVVRIATTTPVSAD